jgi:segregation and condensation protein A
MPESVVSGSIQEPTPNAPETTALPAVPDVSEPTAAPALPTASTLPPILQEMLQPEDQRLTYRITLPAFDGPMELMLHLIKEHEVDIYDIPIAVITKEYLAVLELMESLNLEVAGDFLVMAATLMQIKSRMLLPNPPAVDGEEPEDPRAELVRRLLEYKQFKDAADRLGNMEKERGRIYPRTVPEEWKEAGEEEHLVEVTLFGLLNAFKDVLIHAQQDFSTELIRPEITVTQKINDLMDMLQEQREIQFRPLLYSLKTKLEKIVTFLALLELVRLKLVKAYQSGPFEEIRLFLNENAPTSGAETVDQCADLGVMGQENMATGGKHSRRGKKARVLEQEDANGDGPAPSDEVIRRGTRLGVQDQDGPAPSDEVTRRGTRLGVQDQDGPAPSDEVTRRGTRLGVQDQDGPAPGAELDNMTADSEDSDGEKETSDSVAEVESSDPAVLEEAPKAENSEAKSGHKRSRHKKRKRERAARAAAAAEAAGQGEKPNQEEPTV